MAQLFRFFCYCIVLLGSYHFQTTAQFTSTPLPPSEDPWYSSPENFEATTPGHILRFREAPGDLCSIVANCSRAFNVLYRTTDNNDNASWAVTTLLAPHRNVSECPNRALLSYQIPIDSPDVDQQPSYILYAPNSTELYLDFTGALGRGWFVSVPDYGGPLAAFGAPYQEGQATLDSVRAILRLAKDHPEIGLSPSNDIRYALWGYSGGSIASEWAAELQPTYAPELDFAGAVFGGLVPSFRTVFDEIDGTPFMGNLPAFMVGVTAQAPEARNFLLSKLKDTGPYNASTFLNMSVAGDFEVFASQNLSDYFTDGDEDVFAPILLNLYESLEMGRQGTPSMPLFVYKAIADQFSPVGQTDELVEEFCAHGAKVLYERNTVGDHASEYTNGHTRSLDYLSMVFDGTVGNIDVSQPCLVRNVLVVDSTGPTI